MLFVFVAQADAAASCAAAAWGRGIATGGTVVNCLCVVAGLPLLLVRALYSVFLSLLLCLVCRCRTSPHPSSISEAPLAGFVFPLAHTPKSGWGGSSLF